MKRTFTKEHITGRYTILGVFIAGFLACLPTLLTGSKNDGNQNFKTRDLHNSPVNINNGNQTIYNGQVINAPSDSSVKPPPKKVESKRPVQKPVEEKVPPPIINEGNLSFNNYGTIHQNYYNSKPKPVQRELTEEDVKAIESIPKHYSIDLSYCFMNKECEKYGQEVERAFKTLKYNVSTSLYGQLINGLFDERFTVELIPEIKTAKVVVYVLQ